MDFEDRLARTVTSILGLALFGGAGCGGGAPVDTDTGATPTTPIDSGTDTGTTTSGLAAICDGATPPVDYHLTEGFVMVEPGAACPLAADAQLQVHGCTFLEWQGITCAFLRVEHDQVLVDDGYGGYFADAGSVDSGSGYVRSEVVDVCYYEGVFYLDPEHPTCGRPLLRDGEAVVARVRPGPSGWAAAEAAEVAGLSAVDREALGAHWLASALLEHASVASFAHFSLDLMRLGAPPQLVEEAHRAALDEITHARLCFALASSYLGRPVGPGALPADAAPATSLADVAEALVREGCIGETLAAIDAAARLAVAREPAVRAALEVIVRDESAHAALAWRTLRWILHRDPSLHARLDQVFTEERDRWTREAADAAPVTAASETHGLIAPATRTRELRRGWDEVIAPSWVGLNGAG